MKKRATITDSFACDINGISHAVKTNGAANVQLTACWHKLGNAKIYAGTRPSQFATCLWCVVLLEEFKPVIVRP